MMRTCQHQVFLRMLARGLTSYATVGPDFQGSVLSRKDPGEAPRERGHCQYVGELAVTWSGARVKSWSAWSSTKWYRRRNRKHWQDRRRTKLKGVVTNSRPGKNKKYIVQELRRLSSLSSRVISSITYSVIPLLTQQLTKERNNLIPFYSFKNESSNNRTYMIVLSQNGIHSNVNSPVILRLAQRYNLH